LSEAFGSTTYARPDAIWIARWDNNTALTNETHGGVLINIDSDRFDAPVATVACAYR
jgi:hypothetical protein